MTAAPTNAELATRLDLMVLENDSLSPAEDIALRLAAKRLRAADKLRDALDTIVSMGDHTSASLARAALTTYELEN